MNKVIIVGGNHHNGLGLARSLGVNGINVYSIVIDNICKTSFLGKSKYVSESMVFDSETKAFDYILENFKNEIEKPVLIPYSDGAACELDKRLELLSRYFYVPSLNGVPGAISKMMNKQEQVHFADRYGIRMAKTDTVEFGETFSFPDIPYPCIIKPAISAEGDKKDISVCNNREELSSEFSKYKKKGYSKAIVQEYLNIDYEIDVFGCIIKCHPKICMVPTHTVRSWPVKGGTNSFSYIITDEKIIQKCKNIISCLEKEGFYGLYDIELFVVGEEILLNEINYRNSGDVYMALNQGYYYPYAWVCDCLGLPIDILEYPLRGDYTMTECADIRNVILGELNIGDWLKDCKKCKDYALAFKGDMKPAINRYMYYVRKFFFKK